MRLPTVRTPRLVLQPFCREDVDVLHTLWTDADVRRHLWDDQVISRERALATVEAVVEAAGHTGVGMWTVRPCDAAHVVIGFCGLRYLPDGRNVELLYGLMPGVWRRGLATEAAEAVLRYAFSELRLTRACSPEPIRATADRLPSWSGWGRRSCRAAFLTFPARSITPWPPTSSWGAGRTRDDGVIHAVYARQRR